MKKQVIVHTVVTSQPNRLICGGSFSIKRIFNWLGVFFITSVTGNGLFLHQVIAKDWPEIPRISDQVQEFKTENGMKFLVLNQPGQNNVSIGWVAKVGSANEYPGATGLTHMLEHLLYHGTSKIGVKSAAKDYLIQDQLDILNQKITFNAEQPSVQNSTLVSTSTADEKAFLLPEQLNKFSQLLREQKQNLIINEYQNIYRANGATQLNTFSSRDMLASFMVIPEVRLELWFWMESERLLEPSFRRFYTEKTAVLEERRARIDSHPRAAHGEIFDSLFWRTHSYAWPIYGTAGDIRSMTRQHVKSHFNAFVVPKNLTAVVVGDVDAVAVEKLADKYFGRLSATEKQQRSAGKPSSFTGQVNYRANTENQSLVELRFLTQGLDSRDTAVLELIKRLLDNPNRLSERLIAQQEWVSQLSVEFRPLKHAGYFSIAAVPHSGIAESLVEDVLYDEIERMRQEGVSEVELEAAKNQFFADHFRELRSPFNLMLKMLYFEGLSTWTYIDHLPQHMLDITSERILDVMERYLLRDNMAVMHISPRTQKLPESQLTVDENIRNFSASQQQTVLKMMNNISGFPRYQRHQQVQILEKELVKASRKRKPVIRYVLNRLRVHLSELRLEEN
ncbi:MAG: pitrilysin family protein [Pseudomonadota bacterium]